MFNLEAGSPRTSRGPREPAACALILAGGDGARLRQLTREISGDDRPKQFCPVLGTDFLLDQTRRRARLVAPDARTLVVVTRAHERFYRETETANAALVVQPENRGTVPAILYALLRLATTAPASPVAILPSDHYVSDDRAFMAHVEAALGVAHRRADLVILLGIAANRPEPQYGWIEPAEPIFGSWPCDLYRIRRFVEKPAPALAHVLWTAGALWNSFVMVGRVTALLSTIRGAVPALFESFLPLRAALGTPDEAAAVERLYCGLPAADFSRDVLATRPANLAVLPVKGVDWNDLGDPDRVRMVRRQLEARRQAGGLTWATR